MKNDAECKEEDRLQRRERWERVMQCRMVVSANCTGQEADGRMLPTRCCHKEESFGGLSGVMWRGI